ncbi:MAG: cysteine--tRNA ligase [Candidatus Marinimicrobia bacterium]|jgi:cysteinyl-tRNA synthetase|nr:cysteine--tRNA ligase [Candidatus Neomarinimicrobiota bacterium]
MKFYNTFTRKKEEFKPIRKNEVRMYSCGPTVYNFAHIGNFRSFIFVDILKRYLKFKKYKVKHVMNITDIDDKIIKKCSANNFSLEEYTNKYKEAFFNDLDTLNIQKADIFPKATAHISDMVNLIKDLLDKGIAYKTSDGSIFFNISKFPDYGKLQKLNSDQMKKGKRVETDEYDKDSVYDFALWKGYKPKDGDIFWETEIGKGRPGWHIECSAMSTKYLGKTFDIHTGGVDLIFPHHENEIAQSEGANDQKFVNYWMHCEYLGLKDSKMSKSLGNTIYIKDLIDKKYSARAIRFVLLSVHYRQKLNFSSEQLDSAGKTLKKFDDFIYELKNVENTNVKNEEIISLTNEMLQEFENTMDDDLNISAALGVVFTFLKQINKFKSTNKLSNLDRENIINSLKKIDSVLGVIFKEHKSELTDTINIYEKIIQEKIEERNEARKSKNWDKADKIRNELLKSGVELVDRKEGTTYKIK